MNCAFGVLSWIGSTSKAAKRGALVKRSSTKKKGPGERDFSGVGFG